MHGTVFPSAMPISHAGNCEARCLATPFVSFTWVNSGLQNTITSLQPNNPTQLLANRVEPLVCFLPGAAWEDDF